MKNNYLSTYFAKSSDLQYTKTYLRKLLYGVQYKQVCFYRCSVWLSVGISMHIFFSVGLTKILPREWAREIAIIQVTILKANFITKKIINLFQELLLKINVPIFKKIISIQGLYQHSATKNSSQYFNNFGWCWRIYTRTVAYR